MKVVKIMEMNRTSSPVNLQDGLCDELINLRYDAGVWKSTGDKVVVSHNSSVKPIYIHSYLGYKNYIGIINNNIVHFNIDTGNVIKVLSEGPFTTISSLNNILLICKSDKIEKLIYINNSYSSFFYSLPQNPTITASLIYDTDNWAELIPITKTTNITYDSEFNAKVSGYYNNWLDEINKDENGLPNGYILIRTAFRTLNGNISKLSEPVLINIGSDEEISMRGSFDNTSLYPTSVSLSVKFRIKSKLKLLLSSVDQSNISSIILYCTPLISRFDFSRSKSYNWFRTHCGNSVNSDCVVTNEVLTNINSVFDKQLYFKLKEIDTNETEVIVDCDMFKDITTNEIARNDNDHFRKVGKPFIYNNRLHIFNTKSFLDSDFSHVFNRDNETTNCSVYARLNNETKDVIFLCRGRIDGGNTEVGSDGGIFVSPYYLKSGLILFLPFMCNELRIKKDGNNSFFVKKTTPSVNHNYSYIVATDNKIYIGSIALGGILPISECVQNNNAIYVSAINDPYSFPIEHCYTVSSLINDMAVNTGLITDTQIGQFPVYIFSDNGIYVMEQGSGQVLYSNITPISSLVGYGAVSNKHGIVFRCNNELMLISGKQVVAISTAIDDNIDMSIRDNASFKICTDHDQLCKVNKYVSSHPFNRYIDNCVIGYDTYHDELIVSNSQFNYSYVYQFEHNAWHKITKSFSLFSQNLAIEEGKKYRIDTASITIKSLYIQQEEVFAYQSIGFIECDSELLIRAGLHTIEYALTAHTIETTSAMKLIDVMRQLLSNYGTVRILSAENGVNIYESGNAVGNFALRMNIADTSYNVLSFSKDDNNVIIPAVGVGDILSVSVNHVDYTHTICSDDTILSILSDFATILPGVCRIDNDTITMSYYNYDLSTCSISSASTDYCKISNTDFVAGSEEHFGFVVSDIEMEMHTTTDILALTRPINLNSSGYKSIKRAFLRGLFNPIGHNGAYIYASNDLINWQVVAVTQFDQNTPHIPLNRIPAAYRYISVLICGRTSHCILSHVEIQEYAKIDNKIR